MIPFNVVQNYKIIKYPTYTYHIDLEKKRIIGYTDSKEAMKQAIYKMLRTERFDYVIYNSNYGIELKDLFGKDKYIAYAVLERRIKETLMSDDRITDVYNFDFKMDRGSISVKFTAKTIFGEDESEVIINV